jgi:hypothetical protein
MAEASIPALQDTKWRKVRTLMRKLSLRGNVISICQCLSYVLVSVEVGRVREFEWCAGSLL